MAKRPEGLSPNFNSIVSPQISDSLLFSWTFIKENSADSQKSYTLKVYPTGSSTAVITVAATTQQQNADLTGDISSLVSGNDYEWELIVTAANNTTANSGKKPFKFVELAESELSWPTGPVPYEYIGTRQYFNDIKTNAISLLNDYGNDSAEEQALTAKAENLFVGDVIPTRADFLVIEDVLTLIAVKESTYKEEVDELIENGLGAGDIHLIYDFFDRLSKIAPAAPSNVYLNFVNIPAIGIQSGKATNQSVEDLSVDISWEPVPLTKGTCQIVVGSELNEDVSYYQFDVDAGFSDFRAMHRLFYRMSDIIARTRVIEIPMDHIDFEHLSSSKNSQYNLNAKAIDKRGSESPGYFKTYGIQVPLGVASYNLRHSKYYLNDTTVFVNWYDIYNGKDKAYVHTVSGDVTGYHRYAVRLTDKNGTVSDFLYIPEHIKIDPLKAPAAPKPTATNITQTSFTISWPAVATAETYEVDPIYDSQYYTQTATYKDFVSGAPNTSYTVKVRAVNRAGASAWVSCTAKTLPRPVLESYSYERSCKVWRGPAKLLLQSGGTKSFSPYYYSAAEDDEVLHGEWIELKDKYESGYYVKAGTAWGENKSIIFLDYDGWKSKLAGKQILSVAIYIQRLSTAHGYPSDGRVLNVWTHNYANKSALPSASTGPSFGNRFEATGLDWNRGEGHWVYLPKYFGEGLRDGWMKGIGLFHPNSRATPYEYMRFDMQSFQFWVQYQ